MPRGRELLHIPVTAPDCEQVLGEVVDLVFDVRGRLIALIVLPKKGLFRTERWIGVDSFRQITESGAVLAGHEEFEASAEAGEKHLESAKLRGGRYALCGRTIVLEDGREIGSVGDVVLEDGRDVGHLRERELGEEMGSERVRTEIHKDESSECCSFYIWGFEVSDGALMDLLDGRSVVDGKGAQLADDSVILTSSSDMNLSPKAHPTS